MFHKLFEVIIINALQSIRDHPVFSKEEKLLSLSFQ